MAGITPQAGEAAVVPTGGTSLISVTGIPAGVSGFITNPADAADQGLADAEPLYVNPTEPAALEANGLTFRLDPGQTWSLIPGQITSTWVNAQSAGHKFSVVWWPPAS